MTNETTLTASTDDVHGYVLGPIVLSNGLVLAPRQPAAQLGGFNAAIGRPLNLSEFQAQQAGVARGEAVRIMGDYSAMR